MVMISTGNDAVQYTMLWEGKISKMLGTGTIFQVKWQHLSILKMEFIGIILIAAAKFICVALIGMSNKKLTICT